MWSSNKISEFLNIKLPLIQAPMAGGVTTTELVAAVSNAGGLGSLGAGYMSSNEIRKAIQQIRQLTSHPFGVNLFIPEKYAASQRQIEQARNIVQMACHELHIDISRIHPPYAPSFEEQIHVILEEKIPVLSFTFGVLSESWIKKLKETGVILIGTATTLEEAKLLEERKIDMVVAQGGEAGGHRGTFLGKAEDALMSVSELVPLLVKNLNIPVVAAGGIMNAKNIVAALKLGACAVQMGTAFLSCPESGIHALYKKLLLNLSKDSTGLTRAFSGKLARGITNKFMTRMQSHKEDILDYPIQNALTQGMRKEAGKQNNLDFMTLWVGQSAYLCQALPAAQLIRQLNEEMTAIV